MNKFEVVNCFKCGRIFRKTDESNKCKKCIEEDKELVEEVRSYILDHPGVDIYDVSEKFKISKREVLNFINEDIIQVQMEKRQMESASEIFEKQIRKNKFRSRR